MNQQGSIPRLPDGVDEQEYEQIRRLMRASVLRVWRGQQIVMAGADPWDVVAEAWLSMAESGFRRRGPIRPFACAVARNKAVDALRRARARPIGLSLDATREDEEGNQSPALEIEVMSAEAVYFDAQGLVLVEEALDLLDERERAIFLAVRVDGRSGAAVGRELSPQISGQRVGQILARALIKMQAYLADHEDVLELAASGYRAGAGGEKR